MAAKRKIFTCPQCGDKSSKTISNYFKTLHKSGIVLCGKCASDNANKLKSDVMKAKYAAQPKNTDIVICNCIDCGKPRQMQRRAIRDGYVRCKRCAAKLNRATNKEVYQKLAAQRVNNPTFSASVIAGMMTVPVDIKITNAKLAASYWQDEERKSAILLQRQSDEYRRAISTSLMSTKEEFTAKARNVHNDKYHYDEAEYAGCRHKILIGCEKHGLFTQTPADHLNGCGCQKCASANSVSKGHQQLVEFLTALNIQLVINDRNILKPYEADIYIPAHKLAIEFHGIYRHSYGAPETIKQKLKHMYKANAAESAGVRLLQFWDYEWNGKNKIVCSMISHNLQLSHRDQARKCHIVGLDNIDAVKFMDENHLQGGRKASWHFGLKYNDALLAVMSLSRHPKYQYELIRYAVLCGHSVAGGFTKLLKYAVKQIGIQQIMSYADRRYSSASSYQHNGFTVVLKTKPDYCYVKKDLLFSRQHFQKHKLSNRLEAFDPTLSESINMFNNKYRRLWGAGHYKLLWSSK